MAHGMSLAGLVCEYVRDAAGEIHLLAVLHTEWSGATSVLDSNLVGRCRLTLSNPR